MEFLFFVLIVFLFIGWSVLSSRIRKLRDELVELRSADHHRALLTSRVYHLEQAVSGLNAAARAATPAVAAPESAASAASAGSIAFVAPSAGRPATVVEPAPAPAPLVVEAPPEPVVYAPPVESDPGPPAVFAPPSPTWGQRLATSMAGREWEAILGGSLLNKLGVLVLIIGIGLFLGYSFTQMGPAGRVITALSVSAAMLLGGVSVERRSVYRVFGRGLIGGGWAGLYFTTYAAHAISAARVIESQWLASVLLAVVAAGIIAHSLKYRSQAITGLAYFVAFATFALTPVTSFSVLALLPLAASLLYLSHRFDWYNMALFGVLATYGTCASRGDSGASIAATQGIVAAYWVLFEAFVVLRASRPGRFSLPEQWIFPLNMLGLVALSLPKWQHAAPKHIYAFMAGAAAVTLAGALARAWVRPPSSDTEPALPRRMASGGYEGPITLTALFLAIGIALRFTTVWITFGLAMEAQLFVLAGLWLRQAYLHRLGAAVFGVASAKLLIEDSQYRNVREWWPVALLSAVLMYVNRWLIPGARYFSYGATLVAALLIGFAAPGPYVTAAWFFFAAVLLELGIRRSLLEFRIQGYALVSMAMGALLVNNLGGSWIPAGLATAIAYWICIRVEQAGGHNADCFERRYAPTALSCCTTACAIVFASLAAPPKFIGAAWVMVAAVMFELGLRRLPAQFRWLAYIPLSLGWLQVGVTDLLDAQKTMPLVARLNLGFAALFSYAISARVFALKEETIPGQERRWLHIASSFAGTTFVSTLLWVVLPPAAVAVGWAVVSLALVELGGLFDSTGLRVQGDWLAAATAGRLFLANFVNAGSTFGVPHRLLTVLPIVVSQYYAWWQRIHAGRHTRWDILAGRAYLYAAPVLAVLLMRFELGRVLTVVGWAAFTLTLFWIGVRRPDFDFRLQAYLLALLCFWRSWTTNFYVPESFAGMPGRIATAAFVVAALHAAQFLAPRMGFVHETALPLKRWVERYPRAFFAIPAVALVTLLLRYEVSGGMLTVAWGLQAVSLLSIGFLARERVLRISGLFLFLVCILKLFLYDLRNLETMNRILSFIVLGAVMVGVSWIYTRFREQIQKYL